MPIAWVAPTRPNETKTTNFHPAYVGRTDSYFQVKGRLGPELRGVDCYARQLGVTGDMRRLSACNSTVNRTAPPAWSAIHLSADAGCCPCFHRHPGLHSRRCSIPAWVADCAMNVSASLHGFRLRGVLVDMDTATDSSGVADANNAPLNTPFQLPVPDDTHRTPEATAEPQSEVRSFETTENIGFWEQRW